MGKKPHGSIFVHMKTTLRLKLTSTSDKAKDKTLLLCRTVFTRHERTVVDVRVQCTFCGHPPSVAVEPT